MSANTEFDLGSLIWVKGEIQQTLEKSRQCLNKYLDSRDTSELKFTQTHLHQVRGAVEMVGLFSVARLSEELEVAVGSVERDAGKAPAIVNAVMEAMLQINQFLDALVSGAPNIGLKLKPAFKAVRIARGELETCGADLFFPSLSGHLPAGLTQVTMDEKSRSHYLKTARRRFEAGLLKWLKGNKAEGAQWMSQALLGASRTQQSPVQRGFWWGAAAFCEGLIDNRADIDLNLQQLLTRLNLQLRRLSEGSVKVAERLYRDVLYANAHLVTRSKHVHGVRRAFDLDAQVSPHALQEDAKLLANAQLARELKEILNHAKENWSRVSSGAKDKVHVLQDQLVNLAAKGDALELKGFAPLAAMVGKVLARLQGAAADPVALEVATALLVLENAVLALPERSSDFPSQAAAMIKRLELGDAAPEVTLLDDVSRRAQERMLVTQVCHEIQSNLRFVEQVLDAFFRDASTRNELATVDGPIAQIRGALTMLDQAAARELLDASAQIVTKCRAAVTPVPLEELEFLAEALSSLGFYIDALQREEADSKTILLSALRKLKGEAADVQLTGAVIPDPQKAHAEMAAVLEPEPELDSLPQPVPEVHFTEAPPVVVPKPVVQTVVLEPVQMAPVVAVPIAESKKPAPVSEAAVDAELLEVYLEEAVEVLGNVADHLAILRQNGSDKNALTVLRRGFHTLKGSGRMVGLNNLGEVAWAVEQVMNKWLQDELPVTDGVLQLLDMAHQGFVGWIDQLQSVGEAQIEASDIFALAEQLKSGEIPRPAFEVLPAGDVGSSVDLAAPIQLEPLSVVDEPPLLAETLPSEVVIGELSISRALFSIFLDEAHAHYAVLNRAFVSFQQDSQVPDELVHAAHTLCGIANTTGFTQLGELGYAIEQALMAYQAVEATPLPDDQDILGRAVDQCGAMLGQISSQEWPEAEPQTIALLHQLALRLRVAPEPMSTGQDWTADTTSAIQETELIVGDSSGLSVEDIGVVPDVLIPDAQLTAGEPVPFDSVHSVGVEDVLQDELALLSPELTLGSDNTVTEISADALQALSTDDDYSAQLQAAEPVLELSPDLDQGAEDELGDITVPSVADELSSGMADLSVGEPDEETMLLPDVLDEGIALDLSPAEFASATDVSSAVLQDDTLGGLTLEIAPVEVDFNEAGRDEDIPVATEMPTIDLDEVDGLTAELPGLDVTAHLEESLAVSLSLDDGVGEVEATAIEALAPDADEVADAFVSTSIEDIPVEVGGEGVHAVISDEIQELALPVSVAGEQNQDSFSLTVGGPQEDQEDAPSFDVDALPDTSSRFEGLQINLDAPEDILVEEAVAADEVADALTAMPEQEKPEPDEEVLGDAGPLVLSDDALSIEIPADAPAHVYPDEALDIALDAYDSNFEPDAALSENIETATAGVETSWEDTPQDVSEPIELPVVAVVEEGYPESVGETTSEPEQPVISLEDGIPSGADWHEPLDAQQVMPSDTFALDVEEASFNLDDSGQDLALGSPADNQEIATTAWFPPEEAPLVMTLPEGNVSDNAGLQAEAPPIQTPVVQPDGVGVVTPLLATDLRLQEIVATDELDEQLLPIFLEEAQELLPVISTQMRNLRADPASSEAVDSLRRQLHTLKGSARMAGAMRLGEATHNMETRLNNAGEHIPMELIEALELDLDVINEFHDRLIHGEPQPVVEEHVATDPLAAAAAPGMVPAARQVQQPLSAVAESEAAKANIRVRADLIDRLVNQAGEVSISRSRIESEMQALKRSLQDLTDNVGRLRTQLREIEIQAESQMQSQLSHVQGLEDFDPLEFDRFTRLQELTRFMAESVNDVATVQHHLLKNLDESNAALVQQSRMTKDLQQELMRMRMVPFGSVSDRMYRLVRQTGKETGKKVNLELRGARVEIDRSVLEKMISPFEHMLRNAIDHGLEKPDVRLAQGKNEFGEIVVEARQEGNELVYVLRDDGAGLDLKRIREKGLEKGLINANERYSDSQIMHLIFEAGFSTASAITQLSGRGIGMDVVKNEIEDLGGRVEVSSEPGKGTTFTIHLPLTLAVTQTVLIKVGEKTYAIPSVMVEQVQELKIDALERLYQNRSLEWMGHVYPFHYLPRLIGYADHVAEQKRYNTIMLLRSGIQRIAIHVDQLLKNQEVVVKNIGPQLVRVAGMAGATVLGNGEIVLILNPLQLAQRRADVPMAEFEASVTASLPTAEEEVLNISPVVMVVDDSLTVRKITGRLLAREGYQVETAKDGVDALQQLHDIRPAVMLVDVEMPRMDGFELTRNVRANASTRDIPIIMITSRTADKHKNYAFELGVNVFLGKPYQEDELLENIRRLISTAEQPA